MNSTFHELNSCLIRLNQAVIKQDKTLEIDSIDDQIAYHQDQRNRIARSKYTTKGVPGHDHTFKQTNHKNYDKALSDEYDDHYYAIVNLKCKKQLLMDMQA